MLREYEYVFCVNLQKKLKEEIFGSIFTTVNRNELYIKIEHYDGLIWEQTIDNFADRILNGWTSDYAAYEITEQYRKFVINRMMHKYFVQTKKRRVPGLITGALFYFYTRLPHESLIMKGEMKNDRTRKRTTI